MSLLSIRYRPPLQYNPSDGDGLTLPDLWARREAFLQKKNINIRHPAYPSGTEPLLSFPPYDNDGVDYDLVIYACYLLVQNDFHTNETPYLSYSKESHKDVISPSSVIITRDCFLHVPSYTGPQPYPVIPSFDHWKFPHAAYEQPPAGLPPAWREASIPGYQVTGDSNGAHSVLWERDSTCRVTDHITGLETAHIVPVEASFWFRRNNMNSYALRPDDAEPWDDVRNRILLRADISVLLDRKEIVIMPKKIDGRYRFVLKVITSDIHSYDLFELYHNRICHELRGIRSEYLFGRFAWNIFNPWILQFTSSVRLRCKVYVFDEVNNAYKVQDRRASDFYSYDSYDIYDSDDVSAFSESDLDEDEAY